MSVIQFIKNWSLPVAMLVGALSYFTYTAIPALEYTKPFVTQAINILQPILIFAMLFITFCKINYKELRPRMWHLWLLLIQAGLFALLGLLLILFPEMPGKVIIESAMLCFICPTATAAAVVVGKLEGNAASLTTYIIFINIVTALVVPVFVPLIHPKEELTFLTSFTAILGKVLPLLFLPLLSAIIVRHFFPRFIQMLQRCKDLAFYIWLVALAIAIALTVRSIVHSRISIEYQMWIALTSFVCCFIQFYLGRRIGKYYGEDISAGQSIGQKNTVFAIWMAYTFMTPITSIAGGFYSVWHNLYNSYQLNKMRKRQQTAPKADAIQ